MLVKIQFYPVAVEKEILHFSFSMKTIQEARLFPTETMTELDLKQNKTIQRWCLRYLFRVVTLSGVLGKFLSSTIGKADTHYGHVTSFCSQQGQYDQFDLCSWGVNHRLRFLPELCLKTLST